MSSSDYFCKIITDVLPPRLNAPDLQTAKPSAFIEMLTPS